MACQHAAGLMTRHATLQYQMQHAYINPCKVQPVVIDSIQRLAAAGAFATSRCVEGDGRDNSFLPTCSLSFLHCVRYASCCKQTLAAPSCLCHALCSLLACSPSTLAFNFKQWQLFFGVQGITAANSPLTQQLQEARTAAVLQRVTKHPHLLCAAVDKLAANVYEIAALLGVQVRCCADEL